MTKAAADADTPDRAARPDGRAVFQRRRKQDTRAAILAAAGRVFAATPYVHARIDDIIREAGVSRAAFYLHFESKLALAIAIYDEIMPAVNALFGRLPEVPASDREAIIAWLRDYVALYVEHRFVTPLLAQLQLFEADFRKRNRRDRDAHVRLLREAGIASVAETDGDDRHAIMQRARAWLLLQRLTTVCGEIARGEGFTTADIDAHLTLVAAELQGFLTGPADSA